MSPNAQSILSEDRPDPLVPIAVCERGKMTLTLFCNRLERVVRSGGAVRERVFIYFGGLPEFPDRVTKMTLGSRVALVIAALLVGSWAFIAINTETGEFTRVTPFWIGVGIVAAAVVLSIVAAVVLGSFRYRRVFLYRVLENPPRTVPAWYIDDRGSEAFVAAYSKAHRAWQDRMLALQDAARGEGSDAETLRQFAKLRDDGILDEAEFGRIKDRLVGGVRRGIGFQ